MTADVLSLVPTLTNTTMPEAAPLKRCAIVGTAPSWRQCPYDDPTLEIWSLNDAYLIGVPKAHRWYDLHPRHQMFFRDPHQRFDPTQLPPGVYVRPAGHLDWLRSRGCPVFLAAADPTYPTSQTFPQEAVLAHFAQYWPYRRTRQGQILAGTDYEVSTPAWMLMHAMLDGYREIHVYGIHLATEWEYQHQRPNFEFLLGVAAGQGIKIVLPQSTPICKGTYRYAFEPKIDLPLQASLQQAQRIKDRGLKVRQALKALPIYARGRKTALREELAWLDVQLADVRQQQAHTQSQLEGLVR